MKRTTRATFAALSAVGAIVGAGASLSGTAWVNAGTQGDPQTSAQATQTTPTATTTLTALQTEAARLRGLLNHSGGSTRVVSPSVPVPAPIPAPVNVAPQPPPPTTNATTGASGARK
jgi:hypothetical protein